MAFRARWVVGLVFLLSALVSRAAAPHLEKQGTAMRLMVHGKPFLMLGGELGNSSASSAAYMAPHWARLKQMHLNTVLTPVYWELIEPTEGHFAWHSVDTVIKAARANDLHLVLLWFGAWKNSMSTYPPSWVKRDQVRFPRARLPDGRSLDILSAFSSTTREADSRAFVALMDHLRAVDSEKNTVVMIQVENEIGMLPAARDYSPEGQALFRERVPEALIDRLKAPAEDDQSQLRRLWSEHGARSTGDWPTLFGDDDAASEAFMAWHYARYVESLVTAGKAVYPLPMYVNTALNHTNRAPGEYTSGPARAPGARPIPDPTRAVIPLSLTAVRVSRRRAGYDG